VGKWLTILHLKERCYSFKCWGLAGVNCQGLHFWLHFWVVSLGLCDAV